MIILVRHGETAGNQQRVLQVAETPLNATGLAQARRLAERLREYAPTAVLCSDLPRARMTAEPFVGLTSLPVEYTELLQERNFGDIRGTPYAELGFDPFMPGYDPPGGESWELFYQRVAQAFALMIQRRGAQSGNLVVVTHGLVCGAILARHARLADGMLAPLRVDNTSVTLLDPEEPHLVRLLNCTRHLDTLTDGAGAA
ncbi:MAG: histidine phosphatase family protein [Myxococcales bacterium]